MKRKLRDKKNWEKKKRVERKRVREIYRERESWELWKMVSSYESIVRLSRCLDDCTKRLWGALRWRNLISRGDGDFVEDKESFGSVVSMP